MKFFLVIAFFISINAAGQELYVYSEPASNMPAHSISTKLTGHFVTAKQFKKLSLSTKMSCVQTGKAASCCTKMGVPADARVYHVTI